MPLRLVIADDHPLSLAGLVAALSDRPGVEVVGKAENGISAIAMVKSLAPDCAVLDLTMPGATGLEVILELRRWNVATRFAVVTGAATPQVMRELEKAGVEGIFLKNSTLDDLCDGILRVAAGETVHAEAVRQLLDQSEDNQSLTAREIQVLQAIARGMTNQAASEALGINAKTIETHRTNLMRKLGVHSTASLLVRAMRDGLIDVSDI